MEKKYTDFTPLEKKGINRLYKFSLKNMKRVVEDYRKKTGKNAYNIKNKGHFYKFVAKWKIK